MVKHAYAMKWLAPIEFIPENNFHLLIAGNWWSMRWICEPNNALLINSILMPIAYCIRPIRSIRPISFAAIYTYNLKSLQLPSAHENCAFFCTNRRAILLASQSGVLRIQVDKVWLINFEIKLRSFSDNCKQPYWNSIHKKPFDGRCCRAIGIENRLNFLTEFIWNIKCVNDRNHTTVDWLVVTELLFTTTTTAKKIGFKTQSF